MLVQRSTSAERLSYGLYSRGSAEQRSRLLIDQSISGPTNFLRPLRSPLSSLRSPLAFQIIHRPLLSTLAQLQVLKRDTLPSAAMSSTTIRASASSKLINRLQHLYNLIREVPSWTSGEEWNKKTAELMIASFKVSEQSIKECFAQEKYLGPAIHTWLFTHAQEYVDCPQEIPDAIFTLDHQHTRIPPLLNSELRKKLEKERKENPSTHYSNPIPLQRAPPSTVSKASSTVKGKEKAIQDGSVKVKLEKGVKDTAKVKIELKQDRNQGKRPGQVTNSQFGHDDDGDTNAKGKVKATFAADKGKGKESNPKGNGKADGAAMVRDPASRETTSKSVTFRPATSNKRPPLSSSSSEDDNLPVPSSQNTAGTGPRLKKARHDASPDPSLTAMNRETSTSDHQDRADHDAGIEGFWTQPPRDDELPTGNIRLDVAEAIRVFKQVYSKMAVVQANYDTLLAHSNRTDQELRELKKLKIEPLVAHSEHTSEDLRDLKKHKVDPIQVLAHEQSIATLKDDIVALTKQNTELKNQVATLTRELKGLALAISNRTDLVFEPLNAAEDSPIKEPHRPYSSMEYDPQMLPYLANGADDVQPIHFAGSTNQTMATTSTAAIAPATQFMS
ncbi:hypothetical protein CC1G_02770 [Coprinopsis cinerea okayama7|uniref:Uncharacterized protein n=1 Tax=Coprinopsis cinerea (strain Okayama-7 / 130 / ATCC MYA-4618 / FGSC 9003) TaxID=240176 RepID=A8MZZ9_COPC7|nr:hypothetical protein CC1G_02770 [Coprinopsis cinerea okayama7\|eukprot:XP_001828189.2 hypothetical protein CC1G_02770 [Coprinopsis cinerea okayama7\